MSSDKPADRVERRTAEDAVCADGLRGPVGVHPDHHRAVKKIRLLGRAVGDHAVVLIAVGLHRLDKPHVRIFEMPEHAVEQVGRGFVIGIEHHGDLPGRLLQRVVDVPRLGVLLHLARDVADAQRFAGLTQHRIIALVAKVVRMRIADRLHREQRTQDHPARFARAGRRQDIHRPRVPRLQVFLKLGPRIIHPLHHPPERAISH
jgi:hypothetical protein